MLHSSDAINTFPSKQGVTAIISDSLGTLAMQLDKELIVSDLKCNRRPTVCLNSQVS